jgi:hypothetical protein
MKTQLASGAARFAHLLGMGRLAAQAQDDDDEDKDKDKGGKKAEDDDSKDKDASAQDDDGEDDDDEDEDEDKDKEDKDDKGGKKAEDDDDTSKAMRSARQRERARCAAIFSTPAAAGRPDLAAHLAFNTGMSAPRAARLLEAAALPVKAVKGTRDTAAARLDERMAHVDIPNPGGADAVTHRPNVSAAAAAIIAANERRLGLTK